MSRIDNKMTDAIKNGNQLNKIGDNGINILAIRCSEIIQSNYDQDPNQSTLHTFIIYCINEHKHITDKDFENIMYYGTLGELGDSYSLNMRSYNRWLKEYDKRRIKVANRIHDENEVMSNQEYMQGLNKILKKGLKEDKFSPETTNYLGNIYK